MKIEVHLCFYIKNNYIINIIHLIINVEIKIVACLSDWIPLHSPHPNIYKFDDHIKGIDQKNSLRIIEKIRLIMVNGVFRANKLKKKQNFNV
jgi:hypothetical protein